MLFKFKFDDSDEIYTFLQITKGDSVSGSTVWAINSEGRLVNFGLYQQNYIQFLDPEITNSPLYKAMGENA